MEGFTSFPGSAAATSQFGDVPVEEPNPVYQAMFAQLQQQQQLLNAYKQQAETLMQQVQDMSQAQAQFAAAAASSSRAAAAAAGTATSSSSVQFKIPKPDVFTGKKPAELHAWLVGMKTYLELTRVDLDSEEAAVYAATYLREDALRWYDLQVEKAAPDAAFADYHDLKTALTDIFLPGDQEANARTRLDNLKQTGAASAYNAAFNALVCRISSMSEADQVHRYVAGLKQHVQVQVRFKNPHTLTEAQSHAVLVDDITWNNRTRVVVSAPAANSSGGRQSGPTPMELGAHQAADSRYATYRCNYCKEIGHIRRDCLKWKADSKGQGGGRQQQKQSPN